MKQIEASVKALHEVLCNKYKFYVIPNYQRPYAWEQEQISQLIGDLVDAFLDKNEERYFCGSIVLAKSDEKKKWFDVIDGQQRLTTFVILCCILRDFYSDKLSEETMECFVSVAIKDKFGDKDTKIKLRTDDNAQIDFEQKIIKKITFEDCAKKMPAENSSPKFVFQTFGCNRYVTNAWFLKNEIDAKIKDGIDLNDFVKWIFEHVDITEITASSTEGAMRIFNVLNARGMQLSQIDIVKSTLMGKLFDKKERSAFKAKWDAMNIKFGTVNDFTFEDMMTSYANYIWDSTTQKTMSKELEKYYNDKKMNSNEAISDISEFADAYYDAVTMQSKMAFMIRYLPQRAYPVAILAAAKKHKFSDTDYNELLRILVVYCYQNWIAGATLTRAKQTYVNILNLIRENKAPINTIKVIFKKNLEDSRYNTTKNFKDNITSQDVYSAKWCKPLLILLEYLCTDDSKLQFIEIKPSLQVEHILPQNPDKNSDWKNIFSDEEHEELVDCIGNLTLLSGVANGKNQEAGNKSFCEKKNIYLNGKGKNMTAFCITQEIANDKYSPNEVWDKDAMTKRKDELVEKIEGFFEI